MYPQNHETDQVKPYLDPHAKLGGTTTRELMGVLRHAGGEEILVRRFNTLDAPGPAATRMRHILGPDFYVIRRGYEVWARARKQGEPPLKLRKLRLGDEWMTMPQAAAHLGITQQWFRAEYVNKGHIEKFRFGSRVAVKRADVERLKAEGKPGGVWASEPVSAE